MPPPLSSYPACKTVLKTPPKKTKVAGPSIKTAILVDYMGSDFGNITPEMEIVQHVDNYTELLKPATLDWYQIHQFHESVVKPGTKLILFDYGGVMLGNNLAQDNSRSLLRWAGDNPTALVIVVSSFTYHHTVKHEMEELGLTLPNVIEGHPLLMEEVSVPDWFRKEVGI